MREGGPVLAPGCCRKAEKECTQGHVNGQQLRASQASAERGPEAGPADRSFLLLAPPHTPPQPPTSEPAPRAPRGSPASKRKFLIAHYITSDLATTAAGLHRAHRRGSFNCGSPVWRPCCPRAPDGYLVARLVGVRWVQKGRMPARSGRGSLGAGSPLDGRLRGGLKVQRGEVTYAGHAMELGPVVSAQRDTGFTY